MIRRKSFFYKLYFKVRAENYGSSEKEVIQAKIQEKIEKFKLSTKKRKDFFKETFDFMEDMNHSPNVFCK